MYRIAAGISQDVLGKQLGITFQQIQKNEKGTNALAPVAFNRLPKY
jgi:transcriptional regulator with XRE-family HTH domain